MLSCIRVVLAVSAVATAAPQAIVPRAGPSGQVLSPPGGTVVDQQPGVLSFIYQPVTETTNPGYATQYINLYIWNQDTDVTENLALGLSSPEETEDAITGSLITANFSFAAGGFCGTSLQLVVFEYQTGSAAPTGGFQSAAPYFSIINCYNITATSETEDGILISPPEGATIGEHRDSELVSFQPSIQEQFIPYSFDIDVQDDSEPIDEANSWTTVIHHLYTPPSLDSAGSAWFSPMHWGDVGIGAKRLRLTSYGWFVGVWFTSVSYHNITIVDTY